MGMATDATLCFYMITIRATGRAVKAAAVTVKIAV